METLPPGFEFRPYLDGPGLYVGQELVAHACAANDDPGAPWRLCISPRSPVRYEFLASEAACRRYMAAWARRWEAEIRDRLKGLQTGFEHLIPTGPTPMTRHPRRTKRKGPRL